MTKKQPFAVFDIDGTLIRWQLFHAIDHKLGEQGYLEIEHHQSIKSARMQWKNRESNDGFPMYEKTLLETYLSLIKNINPEDHARIVNGVAEEYKDQTHTYTRNLVKTLKDKGYLLFAISGSHQDAIDRVAQHHGFDAAIGTKFEIINNQFSGAFSTPVHNKKAALDQLVQRFDATFNDSYAVGDSLSDAVLLAAVTHPVAFNPDQRLMKEAREHSWPIVVERKNVVYELHPTKQGYLLT